jgi:hypothetical protein
MMVDFCWMLQRDVPTQKKYTAGNQLKEVSSQSLKDAILISRARILGKMDYFYFLRHMYETCL